MQYDLLIKNGYVVDYASAREGYFDVAVQNGMIAAVESSIGGSAVRELDASGKLVLPGLVDSHVHASAWLGGSYAHTMLVKAGVTSALDMSGPGTSVLELAREYGTGLNLATIEYVRPGHTVSGDDPSSAELHQLITKVQRQGSLGIKLLGGHYPLTVAATARADQGCGRAGSLYGFSRRDSRSWFQYRRPAGGGGAGRRQPSAFSAYQCLLPWYGTAGGGRNGAGP